MRILITGGAGFVGSQLSFYLAEHHPQWEIVVFDNLKRRGSELNLELFRRFPNIKFIHGDIRVPQDFEQLPSSDVFIEASAEPSVHAGMDGSPDYLIQTNLTGTFHALEYARRHAGLLIFLSTSRVYSLNPLQQLGLREGETRLELTESQSSPGISPLGIQEQFPVLSARSLYGATKLCSEILIQEYAQAYGLNAIVNRCGVIAGPGQFGKVDQGVFTLWVANHYFNKPLRYTGYGGTGKQVRDLLHPADLYDLIMRQIEARRAQSQTVFNIGGGLLGSVSMLEMTRICEKVTGNKVSMNQDPTTSPVDMPWYVTDYSLAQKTFGWKPTKTPEHITTDIFQWLREHEQKLKGIFS